ncbi:MAG TPA: hypothetical protein PLO20_03605, partial [Thermogutta sp.]|nr:hypothetical protein [Thermogutta sp.]
DRYGRFPPRKWIHRLAFWILVCTLSSDSETDVTRIQGFTPTLISQEILAVRVVSPEALLTPARSLVVNNGTRFGPGTI